jgi:hypothetical protein
MRASGNRLQSSLRFALSLLALWIPASAHAAANGRSDPDAAKRALQRVQDLKRGIGVRTGRELTPALLDLELRRHALSGEHRRAASQLLARPTDGASDPQGDGYTVAEATPLCSTHFCIHYVTSTADAPALTDVSPANGKPDYVDLMAQVFENEVFPCENGIAALGCADAATTGLGWPQAPSDGVRGGDGRFDVYIKDLFPDGIFGYVAPDPQVSSDSLFSYLVMDKDFSRFSAALTGPQEMRVTAAHEYNHVLQFGIDAFEDTWMFESTATFFENQVYPAIDDYLGYLNTWVQSTTTVQPLTSASAGGGLKIYGSAVWNHFVAGRHGAGTILGAWQAKNRPAAGHSFAPGSYGTAIAADGGTSFSDEFDDFSAAAAEWRAPGSGFPDLYPDVQRNGTLTVGAAATTIKLDHTTFNFQNVAVPGTGVALTLNATLPAGLKGAIALVARTGGSTTAGMVTTQIQRLSNGGAASVTLPDANTYGRITAVLVNADPTQTGFNSGKGDWTFSNDKQSFSNVQVTSGPPPPSATTAAATSIAQTGATLNGSLNPNGLSTTTWFEYGTTTAYGTETTHVAAGSGSSSVPQSAVVSGLTRGTTYHYRIVAQSSAGAVRGADQTFTTLDPPSATTTAASGVTAEGATLNATIDPNGHATSYVFEIGTTAAYGATLPSSPVSAGSGTSAIGVSLPIAGLDPATTYHYRVVATSSDGTTAGGDRTLTTLSPPLAVTGPAGAIAATGATLTGTVNPNGRSTTFTFEYGETTDYAGTISGDAGSGTSDRSVAASVSDLVPGTTYHYRLSAASADGTTAGQDETFTTPTAGATGGTGSGSSTGETTGSTGATGTPGGAGETTAGGTGRLTVALAAARATLRTALRRGLRARVACSAPCSARVELVLSRKLAKRLRLKTVVARARVSVRGSTAVVVTVRFTRAARRALARLRRVSARLRLVATTASGDRAALVRMVRLRR